MGMGQKVEYEFISIVEIGLARKFTEYLKLNDNCNSKYRGVSKNYT